MWITHNLCKMALHKIRAILCNLVQVVVALNHWWKDTHKSIMGIILCNWRLHSIFISCASCATLINKVAQLHRIERVLKKVNSFY